MLPSQHGVATIVNELTVATELALDPLKSKLRKPVNVFTGSTSRDSGAARKMRGEKTGTCSEVPEGRGRGTAGVVVVMTKIHGLHMLNC